MDPAHNIDLNEHDDEEDLSPILELNYKQLHQLPDYITHGPSVDRIQHLYLKRNSLTYLPEDVNRITNLVLLYIPSNDLKTLPESICDLCHLECLNVDSNQLTALPHRIGDVKSLTKLQASRNFLTDLPSSIGKLRNLKCLELMFNDLTLLPEEIGQLVNLQVLNVDSNQLKVLPRQLYHLRNLRELSACKNDLYCLPQGLGHIKNLEYLLVDNNPHLTAVPPCYQITSLGFTGCGSSNFEPRSLSSFTYIEVESRVHYYNSRFIIPLPPEIVAYGSYHCNLVPNLSELCFRVIHLLAKEGKEDSALSRGLNKLLPYSLLKLLATPTSWCGSCGQAVFVTAYPIVHVLRGNPNKPLALVLCCTLDCYRKFFSAKKDSFVFVSAPLPLWGKM